MSLRDKTQCVAKRPLPQWASSAPVKSDKGEAMNRDFWLVVGGIAAGAVGAALLFQNKNKIRPLAADVVAKGIKLKDKTVGLANKAKKKAEDLVNEAKNINTASEAAQ